METILDNIGLPYSGLNLSYSNTGQIGSADADLLVSLKEKHRPTAEYVRELRADFAQRVPWRDFLFSAGRYRDADSEFRAAVAD